MAFLLRIALVIPAVEAVLLVSLEHSKRCAIFTKYPHTTLTDKYIDLLARKVWGDYINTNAQPMDEHEVHTSSCAHGPSIENRINLGFFHNSSEATREAKNTTIMYMDASIAAPRVIGGDIPKDRLYSLIFVKTAPAVFFFCPTL